MALTKKRDIAADSDMWLTHPSHLGLVLDCQKVVKHKFQALEL